MDGGGPHSWICRARLRRTAGRALNNAKALDVPQNFQLDLPARLLAPDFRRVPLYRFDVIVVGSGAAGASAALAAAEDGAQVALIAKSDLTDSNTRWAQGGIAAVFGADDSFSNHLEDTLAVGCGMCEVDTVRRVVEQGPRCVTDLLERGAQFDRKPGGELELSFEGGHSRARVLHAGGDSTGQEMQRALTAAVESEPGITTFKDTFVVELITDASGAVAGVLCLDPSGIRVGFAARETVLATGGAGQIYRETTNPVIATADGVALAVRAGAQLRDLEFFQFHPTCLYIAGAARVLISEIVRGAGGILVDRHRERFMAQFHPDAELAPRDVVSRAVAQRMAETGDTNVYLDLSHVQGDPHELFPGISRTCRYFGIDIARDLIPVRPGLHYMVGGVETDIRGATSLPGLWAVGECASSGLHGANRMGSNSLLEGLVLGADAGRAAAASTAPERRIRSEQGGARTQDSGGLHVNVADVTYSLKSLMWRQMGVVRRAEELHDALPKLDLWTRAVEELAPPSLQTFELLNMLTVARLSVCGALVREESRGTHFRSDFPEPDSAWLSHTQVTPSREGGRIAGVEVAAQALRAAPPASVEVEVRHGA
jgi:L-aspartate oxidase